ncbi:uncharacterized protein LOC111694538 [Trichogramma pretiosum]|uniref:uncharacterized protein LOC111694538 n=1 Tax=Trichogramma pretiosum TaxID=7493 RepID=UPI000C71BB43|nr:uncharacterized protein LOC111694538 [Trichogramma pretiosum]
MTQAPFCLFGLALFSKNLNHWLLCSNLLFIDGLLFARLLFAHQLDFVWQKLKIYLKVNSNMPAVATTSDDDIVLVRKKHPEIFENNQLIKEKNAKWKPIKQKLPNISLHNLYIRIQQNRSCNKCNAQGIQDRLKKIFSHHSEISSFWPTIGVTKTVQDTCKSNENNEEIIKEQIPNQSYTYVDEFDTIHKMKYDVNYSNIINSISCNKLEIIYFSKEQLDLLKDVINCELPKSVIVLSSIIDKTKMRSHISEPVSYLSLSC